MKQSREKHDTASLVHSGEWHGHKVKESGDAERCLHFHHCKAGRSAQRIWRERRAHSCVAARRKEQRRREIGRHLQHAMVELHRRRFWKKLRHVLPSPAASGSGEELANGQGEAPAHQRELVMNEARIEPSDEPTCDERFSVFGAGKGFFKTNQIRR